MRRYHPRPNNPPHSHLRSVEPTPCPEVDLALDLLFLSWAFANMALLVLWEASICGGSELRAAMEGWR